MDKKKLLKKTTVRHTPKKSIISFLQSQHTQNENRENLGKNLGENPHKKKLSPPNIQRVLVTFFLDHDKEKKIAEPMKKYFLSAINKKQKTSLFSKKVQHERRN